MSSTPRSRTRAASATSVLIAAIALLLAACGSEGISAPGAGGGTGSPAAPYADATPLDPDCGTRGASALYWDYMTSQLRLDYPRTMKFLPYVGKPFFHDEVPLYNFLYPTDWRAVKLIDPATALAGAEVYSPDNRTVWRRLNFTASGPLSPRTVLEREVAGLRSFLGDPAEFEVVCSKDSPDGAAVARLLRIGDATANITIQAFGLNFGTTSVFIQVAVAPTAEYDDAAVLYFFPLTGQLTPDGGSGAPECNDGIDNDNDGDTDHPDDEGCTSPEDDSE